MKKSIDRQLTKLADAAFRQAARKVIERAERFGTPVILFVNGEVKAVDPRDLKNRRRRLSRLSR